MLCSASDLNWQRGLQDQQHLPLEYRTEFQTVTLIPNSPNAVANSRLSNVSISCVAALDPRHKISTVGDEAQRSQATAGDTKTLILQDFGEARPYTKSLKAPRRSRQRPSRIVRHKLRPALGRSSYRQGYRAEKALALSIRLLRASLSVAWHSRRR